MNLVRIEDAKVVHAPSHVDAKSVIIQGRGVSPNESFWAGISYYEPGGGATTSSVAREKVYVCLDGCVEIEVGGVIHQLNKHDSMRLAPDEVRVISNKGTVTAAVMIISQPPKD